jgi:hypothetical protein
MTTLLEKIRIGHNGFLAFLLSLALYLLTLSRHYTGGSLEFAAEIESGNWATLLQPQKILVHPIGWAFYHLWQLAGWQGNSLLPSQVLNALAGALCVGIMYHLMVRLTHSIRLAVALTFGFAVSCGMWLFSTEAEFVSLPLAEALLILDALLTTSSERLLQPAFAGLLGLGIGFSALTYITNAFLGLAAIIRFWLLRGQPARLRLRQCVLAGVVALILFVPGLGGVLIQRGSLQLYGGQGQGMVYGTLSWSNLPFGEYEVLRTLAGYPNLGLDDRTTSYLQHASWPERGLFIGFYGLCLIGTLVPPILLVRRRKTIPEHYRGALAALLGWAALNALFAFYWVPRDMQFWMPLLITWWLMVSYLVAEGMRPVHPRLQTPEWWVAGLAGALLLVNGLAIVLPHISLASNDAYQLADSITRNTSANALIVNLTDDHYVPYFSGRQTISLPERVLTLGDKAAALAWLDETLATAQAESRPTYLVVPPLEAEALWRDLAALSITPEDAQRYPTRLAWQIAGQSVFEIVKK